MKSTVYKKRLGKILKTDEGKAAFGTLLAAAIKRKLAEKLAALRTKKDGSHE